MTKIYENVFRSVNIGFVNEMKKICNEMNIDTYKVIEAAEQTFWFYALLSRPWTWRTLHSNRPILFKLEGKQIRYQN